MVDVTPPNPHPADYEPRTNAAVKSVLLEIGQTLGSYHGKFVVIGGTVPWLLLDNPEMPHVGSFDIDLSLDPVALADGEYASLIEALLAQGYEQRDELRRFQLIREVPAQDDGPPISIVVDFLMPREAVLEKNTPPLVENFAVQKAWGADLAHRYYKNLVIEGIMPEGGKNRVEIAVASVPALLAMKGFALDGRLKEKDSYDIYYCIRNYPGGAEALASDCMPFLDNKEAVTGYRHISAKFEDRDGHGPMCARRFAEEAAILGDLTPDQWQTDAFGQVDAWLRAMGLR